MRAERLWIHSQAWRALMANQPHSPVPTVTLGGALAPPSANFPAFPTSWYYFGTMADLRHGPVTREIFGQRLVAFRTASGHLSVLDARCSHLGTDLGCGRVVGEAIQCPYHHWEFATDGRCSRIPATDEIPAFARQRRFPVTERHGHLFVFNAREPLFPLPFYPGVEPDDLLCSPPDEVVLECPWYMIGANAFDLQHFRASHDRELIGEPVIDCPTEFSRRALARFSVAGNSVQDHLTRLVAGEEATLSITDYCGNMMLATATFRRARSYGLVMTQPLAEGRVLVRLMVMKRRSRNPIGRLFYDRWSVKVRKLFFRNFLSADAARLRGVRYNPSRLIPADRFLTEYFQWLAVVSHGQVERQPTPSNDDCPQLPGGRPGEFAPVQCDP